MIKSTLTYHFALLSLPKIHTDLLWLLTIGFCALGLLYFVFVFFFRNKLSKRAALVTERKRELAPIISHFLFHEKESSVDEHKEYLSQKVEIRELIKSKFNRQVLAEILMDLQKDVSGEARQNLYDLYVGLGLHHDAYDKLGSWRWEVISQGILELTQMRVEESYLFIRRFINHSRGVIRKQAQIATVSLKHEGISYFMDTCRYRISEWQQLKLIDVLRHLEDFTPPRFKVWLTSKNKDVVLFALRLIRYYNQNDANQAIIQLIKHKNVQIRSEAIQCLKEFGVSESLDTLKQSFRRSSTEVQLSILDAIGALGSKADIEFLKKVERTQENFTVKSKALTAINTIEPDLIMPIEDIREPSKSDKEYAQTADKLPPDTHQTKLDFEVMKPDKEEPKEEIGPSESVKESPDKEIILPEPEKESPLEEKGLPELEEDPVIFDLCCKEEFEDILEEVNEDEEQEYLSLSFLPLVKDSEAAEVGTEAHIEKLEQGELNLSEEDKFKEDLDNILNKIAMKNDQNHAQDHEEFPEFLPKVVDNDHSADTEPVSEEFLEEMEAISDLIYGKEELFEPEGQAEVREEGPQPDQLLNTEVIAEIISGPVQSTDVEEEEEEEYPEIQEEEVKAEAEWEGFSIFHEMFRDFDAESKLILIDELLVVGEEKELHLLESLTRDPDRRIRKKAIKIRALLADKLKLSAQSEEMPAESGDLLEEMDLPVNRVEELVPVLPGEEDLSEESPVKDAKKLPLEFCFYNPEGSEDIDLMEPSFELNSSRSVN